MKKILSVSLLALGATCAIPAVAQTVLGGHLYIQDPNAPVQITFLPSSSYSGPVYPGVPWSRNDLYIAALDANGNLIPNNDKGITGVNKEWSYVLWSVDSGNGATLMECKGISIGCMLTSNNNTYSYTPPNGTVELVFMWQNDKVPNLAHQSAWSTVPTIFNDGKIWEKVTYTADGAIIGFEDGIIPIGGTKIDWDYDDIVISLTNVGATLPAIPEPETYAMMLAGLGLVGAVARRRRNVDRF
ncbi:MAG: PEPxxWA-CTERM sorting domain-containing protein [Betaproteobacteria bacterium]|nr:PEPxxWA-CTERM sorting domain-containing protein [Betaproteobacteria bacterium]